jgi:hypothetical protein
MRAARIDATAHARRKRSVEEHDVEGRGERRDLDDNARAELGSTRALLETQITSVQSHA